MERNKTDILDFIGTDLTSAFNSMWWAIFNFQLSSSYKHFQCHVSWPLPCIIAPTTKQSGENIRLFLVKLTPVKKKEKEKEQKRQKGKGTQSVDDWLKVPGEMDTQSMPVIL